MCIDWLVIFFVYLWSKVGFFLLSLFTWCAKFKLNGNKFALFVFISPIADLLYFYISLYIIATNQKSQYITCISLRSHHLKCKYRFTLCVRVCKCVCVGCTRSNRIVFLLCMQIFAAFLLHHHYACFVFKSCLLLYIYTA